MGKYGHNNKRKKHDVERMTARMPAEVIPLFLNDRLVPQSFLATVQHMQFVNEPSAEGADGCNPDETIDWANHFFAKASNHIETYRGYMHKTVGSTVMSLYGLPTPLETHALDAVLATYSLFESMAETERQQIQLIIHTGQVTAGMVGVGSYKTYDVIGETVSHVRQAIHHCEPGKIMITASTYEHIEPYVHVQPALLDDISKQLFFEVTGLRSILEDRRRVHQHSLFGMKFAHVVEEVEQFKQQHLPTVDFLSIQSRDRSLFHHEAVASLSVALFRHLMSTVSTELETKMMNSDYRLNADDLMKQSLREDLLQIKEEDLIMFALLHDMGKHALEPVRLTLPMYDQQELFELIEDLRESTKQVLSQLEQYQLLSKVDSFYDFEKERGAMTEVDTFSLIVATADIYDALTAPKVYKGKPKSIQRALQELLNMSCATSSSFYVAQQFAVLMGDKQEVAQLLSARGKVC